MNFEWPEFDDGKPIWPKEEPRMTDPNQLPKQELLIKLLRMTTSDNDGEALTALRKANAFLTAAGWDWEKLILGKIRIIEDPFKNLSTPPTNSVRGTYGTTPPAPAPQSFTQPPPFRPAPRQTWPLGIQPNRFAGFCYCCGQEVVANTGLIFKPSQYNAQASSDWKIACPTCNGSATVQPYAASRRPQARGNRRPFVSDLS